MFRGKFVAALARAHHQGSNERDPQADHQAWHKRQHQLYQHDWVVYAKTPLGGPAQVLEYLSRYTHRTAIGNERIRAMMQEDVVFSVRAETQGAKRRVRLVGTEFIGRFLLHVLPSRCQQAPPRRWSRRGRSWHGWPESRWMCARVARWGGCGWQRCSWGRRACPAHTCATHRAIGGRHDSPPRALSVAVG